MQPRWATLPELDHFRNHDIASPMRRFRDGVAKFLPEILCAFFQFFAGNNLALLGCPGANARA
ncbi:hypothetical protein TKWG_07950 [Advenella kashmirensis WT001]|uniref:Uncharacterized protein n=1 Tax=Advenella kashmirensis (strain DSM 17095 / LMG 22695 / WT001) TaxID=1036672 RepID=I3UAF8_ADVKW|nr:hypothetical protein TKWG_07950 [Advenella kashmirensis WT001]